MFVTSRVAEKPIIASIIALASPDSPQLYFGIIRLLNLFIISSFWRELSHNCDTFIFGFTCLTKGSASNKPIVHPSISASVAIIQ